MNFKEIESLMIWIDAIKTGKTIQSKYKFGFQGDKWFDVNPENFNWAHASKHEFRIKPEPKLRPWKPGEIPVGAILKTDLDSRYLILAAGAFGIRIADGDELVAKPANSFLVGWKCSTDGGNTWADCGIKE